MTSWWEPYASEHVLILGLHAPFLRRQISTSCLFKLKTRLIEEFGSIDIFGRYLNKIFDLLPCFKSVQEIPEDLAPKIKTLQANLEIIQQFYNLEDLHSVSLTQSLIQGIMRSLPMEVRSSFNDQ